MINIKRLKLGHPKDQLLGYVDTWWTNFEKNILGLVDILSL